MNRLTIEDILNTKINYNSNVFGESGQYPTECWTWLGTIDKTGYGKICLITTDDKEGYFRAHRIIYLIFYGTIDDNKQLDHLCRNRKCVNPEHLEEVTCKENILRGRSPQAINAAKNYCKNGHIFDEQNTHYYKNSRICKQCRLETNRKLKGYKGKGLAKLRTHCPQGHEYNTENTVTYKNGRSRHCKICRNIRNKARTSE